MVFARSIKRVLGCLSLCSLLMLGTLIDVGAHTTPTLSRVVQTAQSYTVTGGTHEVTWESPWDRANGVGQKTGAGDEAVVFADGEGATLVIAVYDANHDLTTEFNNATSAIETSADTYETVDSGSYDAVSYALLKYSKNAVKIGAFAIFIDGGLDGDDVGFVFTSPLSTFSSSLANAQKSISIDGEKILIDVDSAGLARQLGSSISTSASQPTPTSQNPQPEVSASTGDTWMDPRFGYVVEWGAQWSPTDPPGSASFAIKHSSNNMIVGWVALPAEGISIFTYFDAFIAAFEQGIPSGSRTVVKLVGQDKITLAAEIGTGLFIQDVFFIDDGQTMVVTTILATGTDAAGLIDDYRSSVTVAGIAPLAKWNDVYP